MLLLHPGLPCRQSPSRTHSASHFISLDVEAFHFFPLSTLFESFRCSSSVSCRSSAISFRFVRKVGPSHPCCFGQGIIFHEVVFRTKRVDYIPAPMTVPSSCVSIFSRLVVLLLSCSASIYAMRCRRCM